MTSKPVLTDVRAAVLAVASSDRASITHRAGGRVFVCTEHGSGEFDAKEWAQAFREAGGQSASVAPPRSGPLMPTPRRLPSWSWTPAKVDRVGLAEWASLVFGVPPGRSVALEIDALNWFVLHPARPVPR